MDPDRWRRIESLFHAAVALPPEQRGGYLLRECAGDEELRRRVLRLLRDDGELESGGEDLLELIETGNADPFLGRRLGAYRISSKIAVGGMGVVYRGERADGLFEHDVAIKLIRAGLADEDAHRRFDSERRTLATLNHPCIARLYDGGTTEEGLPYLVMEYVPGRTIDRYCREERLGLRARLTLFVRVCQAVQYAHYNLIVHQDLKPGNILIDGEGLPKLLDFGIARFLHQEQAGGVPFTRATVRVLTPEYASPEQLLGAPLTTASDVYSLGVVLYELLTGARPFEGPWRSPGEWEQDITTKLPARPSTVVAHRTRPQVSGEEPFAQSCGTTTERLRRRLAGDLDRIVLLALRKEPERRYDSARQLAEDIERHLAGLPVLARSDSLVYRGSRFLRRHALAVGSLTLTIVGLLVGLVLALRSERRVRSEAAHAQIEADSFDRIADFLMEALLASQAEADPGERQRMLEMLERQAEVARRQYRDPHIQANLLDAIGRACVDLSDFEQGKRLLEEAHAMRVREFGERSLEVALSLGSLGRLAYARGAFAEAEGVMRRALDLQRSCPPGAHTDVAAAANDLATVLRNRGAIEEAEALHLEALAARRQSNPRGLPLADSLNNLGVLYGDRGETERAAEVLREALEIRLEILGPLHAASLQSMANLSSALHSLGRGEEAARLLEQAAEGYRQLGAVGLDGLAYVLSSMATDEIYARKPAEAERHLDEAYAIQRARLGIHPTTLLMLVKRAMIRKLAGDPAAADTVWQQVLAEARTADIPPAVCAMVLEQYAGYLMEAGRADEVELTLAEGIDVLEAAPSRNDYLLGKLHVKLASLLWQSKSAAEAEHHARLAQDLLEGIPDAAEVELKFCRDLLTTIEAQASH